MVKDPGVKLLGRWVRDEMAVPSLPQLREVVGKIHQVPTFSSLTVEVGGKGATHWLPEGSGSVGVGGTPFPGPGVRTKRGPSSSSMHAVLALCMTPPHLASGPLGSALPHGGMRNVVVKSICCLRSRRGQ